MIGKKGLLLMLMFYCSLAIGQDHRQIINDHLLQLADPIDSVQFNACIKLATHYNFLQGSQDSVAYYAQKGLDLANEVGKDKWKISALYYLGLYHNNYSQELELAIDYFSQAKDLLVLIDDQKRLSTVYNAIGMTYSSLGNYEKAMENYQDVFRIATKDIDYATMSNALSNTALVYTQMGENTKALNTYKEALEYSDKDNSEDRVYGIFHTMLNMCDIYLDMDSLDIAESFLPELDRMSDSIFYNTYLERLTVFKLNLFEKRDDSKGLTKLALEAYKDIRSKKYTHDLIYNSVSYHYALEMIKRGDHDTSYEILKDMIDRDGHDINFASSKYLYVEDLAEELGEFEIAHTYLVKYNTLKDSLKSDEKSVRIENLLASYELQKKENELKEAELIQLRLKRNNGLLLTGIMGLLAIGSFVYLWIMRRREKEKEEMYQIEQRMLSLQMNPHFIFNAISSIQNFLYEEGDRTRAVEHLSAFSQLMRQILENSREKFISLEDEIEFMEHYLKLQKLRFEGRFDYEIYIDPKIDIEHTSIPPLLTQPFIENAIEHGQLFNIANGKVKIRIVQEGESLRVVIEDNGIGIQQLEHPLDGKRKSLAISITKERFQLLTKLIKRKFTLQINPGASNIGTRVQIDLPAVYL